MSSSNLALDDDDDESEKFALPCGMLIKLNNLLLFRRRSRQSSQDLSKSQSALDFQVSTSNSFDIFSLNTSTVDSGAAPGHQSEAAKGFHRYDVLLANFISLD